MTTLWDLDLENKFRDYRRFLYSTLCLLVGLVRIIMTIFYIHLI